MEPVPAHVVGSVLVAVRFGPLGEDRMMVVSFEHPPPETVMLYESALSPIANDSLLVIDEGQV
jgi:hypothetical protein